MDGNKLFNAAREGDIDALHQLLQENPFVLGDYTFITLSENPLNTAAKAGQVRFVQEIIKIKPELAKELNQDGFRPLDVASAYGHVEIVRELLATSDSAICRLPGRDGRTAIHYAAMNGRVEIIDELLKACSDSAKDVTAFGETALHLAVKYFKFDVFRRLMEWLEKITLGEIVNWTLGEIVNWKDKEGNTILHCAVSRKQFETVEYMLDKNNPIRDIIGVNAINRKGLTPIDTLDILIESSSDVQLRKILQEAGGQGAPEVCIASQIQSLEASGTVKQSENVRFPYHQQGSWIDYIRFQKERDSPAEARDMLLVVIALIATVTFQAGINLPSHIFEVSNQPTYNITSAPNSRISWDQNSIAPSLQNVIQEVSDLASTVPLNVFLVANTIAFSTAFSVIDYLREGLPFKWELRVSCFFMMLAYCSLFFAEPAGPVKYICLGLALSVPLFIRIVKRICKHKEDSPDQQ